ncbi:MAG: CHASE2 domain-containing protein [Candidatus Riflebacteria bacterium]|nr:CHASE2 domain-containing protein [Candidatus Riflebacteria bacterium]
MTRKAEPGSKQISEHGRLALLVPFILCLLAFHPAVRQSMEWLDFMFSDFLFSVSPTLRAGLGRPQIPEHPVLIINKDETFSQRFGRDPDRGDFAELLELLNRSGVSVVAMDFLYEDPATTEADTRFCAALASLPLPVLAQRYIGRGRQTFEQVDIVDSGALRPPWPKQLHKPIAHNAAATGLINIVSDLDATVRYLPLAYHPADSEEFMPTLGYAAWISNLVAGQRTQISEKAAAIDHLSAEKLLEETMKNAPFTWRSTGHAGLDQATRRLEAVLIARILKTVRPEMADELEKLARTIAVEKPGERSWLNMPDQPLPLFGSYERPCLRPYFSKQSPPLKGDGIPARSMGTLLETDADRSSPYLTHKLLLDIREDASFAIKAPALATGSSTLSGRITFADNRPVASASILVLSLDTGSWQQTKTGSDGRFSLSFLPEGDFIVYSSSATQTGFVKGTLRSSLGRGETRELPDLIFPTAENRVEIVKTPELTGKAVVFGEPVVLLKSDKTGHIALSQIPVGYELIGLDENQSVTFIDGNILYEDGKPAAEQVVALLPVESQWLQTFFHEHRLEPGKNQLILEGLPTSLDARLAIFSQTGTAGQKTSDLAIMPGVTSNVESLPELSLAASAAVGVSFASNDSAAINITLLGETGKNYRLVAGTPAAIEPGRYLVLLEQGDARGFWLSNNITADTVFIGTSQADDQDFVVTPIKFMDLSIGNIPGVNLHATLFSALKRQSFLRAVFFHSDSMPDFWPVIQFLLLLPLLWLLNHIFIKFGAIRGGGCVLGSAGIWLITATHFFLNQLLLPFFYPLLIIGSFGVVRGYIAWAIARQQERQTRQTFGRFISAAVVDEILRTPGGLKTGSVKKELSVIFTDLAGFTTISEKLEPEQLTELMNEYLDEMTRILFKFGGTLDKYIGDAIMGFWNHPRPQPDHAQRATECAIAMQVKLAELREKWLKRGLPKVEVRAGINAAVCMVGFIGSEIQMNFTCLGDGVNLASRLEGANKAYGTYIMVSDSVHKQIDRNLVSTRFLDYLAVKGKLKPIEVFEVRGYRRDESAAWLEAEPFYKSALDEYLARSWDKAIESFESVLKLCPGDGPAEMYIERCRQFKLTPPPENWDGSYSLKTK